MGQKKKKQSCSSSSSKRKVEGSNIGNVEDEVKFLSTPQNTDENRSLILTTYRMMFRELNYTALL